MREILYAPIITEKAMSGVAKGCYTFKVAQEANKATVAQAISEMYKVKVERVRIIKVPAEKKLVKGRYPATIKGWKKAIVTLKKGHKIPGFEEKK